MNVILILLLVQILDSIAFNNVHLLLALQKKKLSNNLDIDDKLNIPIVSRLESASENSLELTIAEYEADIEDTSNSGSGN